VALPLVVQQHLLAVLRPLPAALPVPPPVAPHQVVLPPVLLPPEVLLPVALRPGPRAAALAEQLPLERQLRERPPPPTIPQS
jgi:hypothetical protein